MGRKIRVNEERAKERKQEEEGRKKRESERNKRAIIMNPSWKRNADLHDPIHALTQSDIHYSSCVNYASTK